MNYLKKILLFCMMAYVLEELVPKEEYRKYLQSFAGMGMIVVILSPFLGLLQENTLRSSLFHFEFQKLSSQEQIREFEQFDKKATDYYLKQYEDSLKASVKKIVESQQIMYLDCDFEFETGEQDWEELRITQITVWVSKKYEEEGIRIREIVSQSKQEEVWEFPIKNMISQFYDVPMEHINLIK